MLFAHVLMKKKPAPGTWLSRDITNNIDHILDAQPETLDESNIDELCSLTWPAPKHGTCAQCAIVGLVHKCDIVLDSVDERDSLFCWEHRNNHSHSDSTKEVPSKRAKIANQPNTISTLLQACQAAEKR
jgi:hypothetical protein